MSWRCVIFCIMIAWPLLNFSLVYIYLALLKGSNLLLSTSHISNEALIFLLFTYSNHYNLAFHILFMTKATYFHYIPFIYLITTKYIYLVIWFTYYSNISLILNISNEISDFTCVVPSPVIWSNEQGFPLALQWFPFSSKTAVESMLFTCPWRPKFWMTKFPFHLV